MKKVVLLALVLATAGLFQQALGLSLISILDTGDQTTYVDTIKLKRTGRPEIPMYTAPFGGDPGVVDTFVPDPPQAWPNEWVVISYMFGVSRQPAYRITGVVEDQWYDLPTDDFTLLGSKIKFIMGDGVAEENAVTPRVLRLTAAPNPFSTRTVIRFGLAGPVHSRVRISDAAGRIVRTILDRRLESGAHEFTWNGLDDQGRRAAPGVYLARLTAGRESRLVKLMMTD